MNIYANWLRRRAARAAQTIGVQVTADASELERALRQSHRRVEAFGAHSQAVRLREDNTRLRVDNQRLRSALARVADNGCGIPGHAVAVGCGSDAIAREALTGDGAPLLG